MPLAPDTAECVVNISEGREASLLAAVRQAGGEAVLDLHTDPDHHRTVLTLAGSLEQVEGAARAVAAEAVARIDLRAHQGVHPRLGAADVVPFVPLDPSASDAAFDAALAARNRFAAWAGDDLHVPCFLYGPERTLPEVRRDAFRALAPDTGPPEPHETAGAIAVGVRPVLVAYNVWLVAEPGQPGIDVLGVARTVAASLRGPHLRALGLAAGPGAQVSMNLLAPATLTVADAYDAVRASAGAQGCRVLRGELVGLLPAGTLAAVPADRWSALDLAPDRTVEDRLAAARR